MKIDERRIKEVGLGLHAWTQAETLAVAAKRKHEKTDGKDELMETAEKRLPLNLVDVQCRGHLLLTMRMMKKIPLG